jgi:transposase InsO family protein
LVAAVLDLFSRRIIGCSMGANMTAQLVMDALLMAIWRRGTPRALRHHSDQGSQYTSEDFRRLLNAHGVTCSMSRRGDCWDNSAMESFFSHRRAFHVSLLRMPRYELIGNFCLDDEEASIAKREHQRAEHLVEPDGMSIEALGRIARCKPNIRRIEPAAYVDYHGTQLARPKLLR